MLEKVRQELVLLFVQLDHPLGKLLVIRGEILCADERGGGDRQKKKTE